MEYCMRYRGYYLTSDILFWNIYLDYKLVKRTKSFHSAMKWIEEQTTVVTSIR